jgi:hypothetical protein
MKCATIIFALLAFATGSVAAWHWYKSTTEQPPEMDRLDSVIRDEITKLTPVEAWLIRGAQRNRKAAIWTAAAVVLGAVSSVLGALS